jgi:Nop14-like family
MSKMKEEDKMRLRYMREQRDQMKSTHVTRKRAKYNLDDLYSDDNEDGGEDNGFTHGGRPLENVDDFRDEIPVSSDEEEGINAKDRD